MLKSIVYGERIVKVKWERLSSEGTGFDPGVFRAARAIDTLRQVGVFVTMSTPQSNAVTVTVRIYPQWIVENEWIDGATFNIYDELSVVVPANANYAGDRALLWDNADGYKVEYVNFPTGVGKIEVLIVASGK